MKITWKFANETISEIEVSEEIGSYINSSRRKEESDERKHRRHCYSFDAIDYEGEEYASDTTPEDGIIQEENTCKINVALNKLTEKQRRRLLMLADGLSVREIARRENADFRSVYESIEAGKNKIMNSL